MNFDKNPNLAFFLFFFFFFFFVGGDAGEGGSVVEKGASSIGK